MMKKVLVTSAILSSLALAGEHWNIERGGVTMKFLSMQTSARTAALSGAGIADPSRVSEVSRNPLAMSVAKDAELGINQIIFGEGAADNFVSVYYGIPFTAFGKKLAASATVDFVGYDNIEGRDENGELTMDYGVYAWNIQAGVGSRGDVSQDSLCSIFRHLSFFYQLHVALLNRSHGFIQTCLCTAFHYDRHLSGKCFYYAFCHRSCTNNINLHINL